MKVSEKLLEKAKSIALQNQEVYHFFSCIIRNNHIVATGTNNSKRLSPYRLRDHYGHVTLHAEMSVLSKSRPGDKLLVLRFKEDHSLSCAKPCRFCEALIRESGVKKVYYSDWDSQIKKMVLT